MTLIFILLFFLYFIFVVLLIIGWNKATKRETTQSLTDMPLLTVVVPARNEQACIGKLLLDLQRQTYTQFEVIVVDDHSSDETRQVARRFAHDDLRFHVIESVGEGKKTALNTGISRSRGDIIITTDADCTVSPTWLEDISGFFGDNAVKLVFGTVKIESKSWRSNLQAHEFLSLIGTAVATWALGYPSMCNGANLAFRKSVFTQVGGYDNNYQIPSGDDEFLMHKIARRYPHGIRFLSSREAVVKTGPAASMKAFVHQRIRWAGKWRYSLSLASMLLGLFIFLFQTSVMFLPLAIYMNKITLFLGASLLIFKAVLESFFLKKVADFLRVPWSWSVFFFLQIVYPFYAVFIGLFSTFTSFEWKGRRLRSVSTSVIRN